MRTVAAALLALFLGQALALPVLEGPCTLAQCASDQEDDCAIPCSACLCCSPARTLPQRGVMLAAAADGVSPLVDHRGVTPPDTPPHEILHVPKA